MKRLALLLLALCLVMSASAFTFTDDTNAEFQAGDISQVNSTSNTLILNLSGPGTYAASGTYTSRVFDLGSNPSSTIAWTYNAPTSTSVLVSTRSGPTSTVDGSWTSWSSNYATPAGSTVTSTTNRYLQYRIQLATTNTTNTPTISAVTLSGSQLNTSYTLASYVNLTSLSTGAHTRTATITDTLTIINVTARYRVNASGAWSARTNITPSGSSYAYSIAEPAGGWDSLTGSTLHIDFNATVTNGSVISTTNRTFTEIIEFVNTLPVIDPIADATVLQGTTLSFTVTATDIDGQTLTWTANETGATMTSLTATSATFSWAPNGSVVGARTIRIGANDGYGTRNATFVATVTDVNDPPTMGSVTSFTGYYGVRQLLIITATELDLYQTVNFSVSPPYFTIATRNTTVNSSSVSAGTWYGWANFTPLDDERGTHELTFTVTDGTDSDTTKANMTINYCGDNVCQTSYETEATCPADCAIVQELPAIALVAPDRNCANESMLIKAFDAQTRYECYYEGRVVGDLGVCEPLDSVSVTIYKMEGPLFTSAGSFSTDAAGVGSFTPPTEGRYRFYGKKDDYKNATMTVMVRACNSDIVINETTTVVEQPAPPAPQSKPTLPVIQQPGVTQEEQGILVVLFFYLIAPLLAASLVYLSSVFYDVNKDTLPWLLATRIWFYEQRERFEPQIAAVRRVLAPIVTPVRESLAALWNALWPKIKPLVDAIAERLKSLRR